MEHWQGAQWVLFTLLAVRTMVPVLLRIGGLDLSGKSVPQWAGAYIGRCTCDAGLVALLWWGGFWI